MAVNRNKYKPKTIILKLDPSRSTFIFKSCKMRKRPLRLNVFYV